MALRSQLSRRWWCRIKILVKGCCRERRSQFLSVSAAKRQPLPPQSPDLHFFRSHAHLFSTSAPCFPLYTILPYIYSIFLLWRIHRISIRKLERDGDCGWAVWKTGSPVLCSVVLGSATCVCNHSSLRLCCWANRPSGARNAASSCFPWWWWSSPSQPNLLSRPPVSTRTSSVGLKKRVQKAFVIWGDAHRSYLYVDCAFFIVFLFFLGGVGD